MQAVLPFSYVDSLIEAVRVDSESRRPLSISQASGTTAVAVQRSLLKSFFFFFWLQVIPSRQDYMRLVVHPPCLIALITNNKFHGQFLCVPIYTSLSPPFNFRTQPTTFLTSPLKWTVPQTDIPTKRAISFTSSRYAVQLSIALW